MSAIILTLEVIAECAEEARDGKASPRTLKFLASEFVSNVVDLAQSEVNKRRGTE